MSKFLSSDKNPWELVDQVSSPGGTTVAGVVALEEAGFIPAIIKGINTTIEKDLEMLNKNNDSNVFRALQRRAVAFAAALLLYFII